MGNAATNPQAEFAQALVSIRTESGSNLLSLTEQSPVLLVFLRHFGCSFCRKAISDIAELRGELEKRGVRPVFVHLGPSELARVYFEYYKIGDVERICDPDAKIYQSAPFELGKVHPAKHLLNLAVWAGWLKGSLFKHGIGKFEGDAHQMPGIFFLKGPKIERQFIYKNISDEPKYLKLCS
jgi:hypothetical protein